MSDQISIVGNGPNRWVVNCYSQDCKVPVFRGSGFSFLLLPLRVEFTLCPSCAARMREFISPVS